LKARFVRQRGFYENSKEPHLPKMRTIGAQGWRRASCAQDKSRSARVSPIRRDCALERQRDVHHATDHSPFNPRFTIPREWRSQTS